MIFSEESLLKLRDGIRCRMSEKRYCHTLGVERMAKLLGELIIPEKVNELRAAALLHDIAKEISIDTLLKMLSDDGFILTDADIASNGILHSFAGPIVIKRDFPEFATKDILSAVLNHTLGAEAMSVFDKIIFISDYTEDTRPYESCKSVRDLLLADIGELSQTQLYERLDAACVASIDGIIDAIERAGRPLNPRILTTRNALLS